MMVSLEVMCTYEQLSCCPSPACSAEPAQRCVDAVSVLSDPAVRRAIFATSAPESSGTTVKSAGQQVCYQVKVGVPYSRNDPCCSEFVPNTACVYCLKACKSE
jgi:hypothetical protein